MFTPITDGNQIASLTSSNEHVLFDMKGGADAYRRFEERKLIGWNEFEIAKDVAAFANAHGGTILIGAVEDRKHDKLLRFASVSADDAKALREAFFKTVKTKCTPAPMIDARVVSHEGTDLVVVNVWPFFGQVVAVRTAGAMSDGYGGEAYVYPMRMIDKTTYVTAEQIPMFMIPAIRRAAALLSAIPEKKNGETTVRKAVLKWRPPRPGGPPFRPFADCEITTIDIFANTFAGRALKLDRAGATFAGMTDPNVDFAMPLEDVSSVWRDGNTWIVCLAGYFEINPGVCYRPGSLRGDFE